MIAHSCTAKLLDHFCSLFRFLQLLSGALDHHRVRDVKLDLQRAWGRGILRGSRLFSVLVEDIFHKCPLPMKINPQASAAWAVGEERKCFGATLGPDLV